VTFEKEENGRVVKIILHDSLEDVIHNQATGVHYSYEIVSSDPIHSVVICTMSDDNGRCVVGIGESIPATLDTPIAQNYPTLIATQRAFDRAAIRYLNLPGKVFSNTEMSFLDDVVDTIIDDPSDEITSQPAGIVSTTVVGDDDGVSIDTEEEFNLDNVVVDTSEEEVIIVDEELATPPEEEKLPFDVEDEADELTEVGNYVITMNGKYATSGLSIAEIYKKDASWVEWVADNFKARNPVAEKDVAQIKRFVELKRVK
jgi:hypothetical protein